MTRKHLMKAPRLTTLCALSLAITLAACGGGGGATEGATAASSSTNNQSSASSSSRPASSSSSVSAAIYSTQPVVASCSVGVLNNSERTAVLARLNEVRARHGLSAVTYDSSDDFASAQAAMYMVANRGLTHTPSESGACYTSEAKRLAGTSNLYLSNAWGSTGTLGQPSADAIRAYLIDDDVESLGHRRWLLYPFMGSTSFGRVDDVSGSSSVMASTLRTIGGERSSVSDMNLDFVAYPYGNYPKADFGKSWYLSFSAVASKTQRGANGDKNVNFANATISVSNESGNTLAISSVASDYVGYGLPNNLQWKVAGLQDIVRYTVRINNVVVNNATRNYEYSFRLQ